MEGSQLKSDHEEKGENDQKLSVNLDEKKPINTPETAMFKVPLLGKKVPLKKDLKIATKSIEKDDKISAVSLEKLAGKTNQKEVSKENTLLAEKRSPISFRTKPIGLPSQVYKPHQPSAAEFLKRYSKNESEKVSTSAMPNEGTELDKKEDQGIKSDTIQKKKEKSSPPPLKYDKPSWSCSCVEDSTLAYSLEVLKTGLIIDKITLTSKDFFVFGRLADCDVVLEHPSISRHHAILQFGKPTEDDNVEFQKDGSAGFYLVDLGSTHGTFLNKARVPVGKYYRVKVGHMMKFGGSSRMYILQGPSEDEEKESEETATELLKKTREKRNKKDLAKMMMGDDSDDEDDTSNSSTLRSRRDNGDTGVTWGMLEEAVMESDEEEDEKVEDKNEEILFSLQDKKEPFYVKDPHKALKNFYEKEGLEVEFECTERRPGQWNIRLELPVDTPSGKAVIAEATLTGKKKDATLNCALEACRLLDKYGMFKQSEHHRRKVKQWEKEDFYDSDEDQYWDRTGDLDKKRRQRKLRVGVKKKSSQDQPETYESLKKQIDDLEKEIAEIEKQLEKDRKATQTKQNVSDPLEEFMLQVKSGKTLDSVTRSKMKLRLFEARKESARLVKLAEIARPVSLPPLNSTAAKSMSFIGRMRGKKKGRLLPSSIPTIPKFEPIKITNDDVVEEDDDDDVVAQDATPQVPTTIESETSSNSTPPSETAKAESKPANVTHTSVSNNTNQTEEPTEINSNSKAPTAQLETEDMNINVSSPINDSSTENIENRSKRKRAFGPTLPQDLKDRLLGVNDDNEPSEAGDSKKKKKKNRKQKERTPGPGQTLSNDPDYADWMPPEGQTGDGTTSLNAKFGY